MNDTISVYDSKFSGAPLSSSLKVQLALIYKARITEEEKFISLERPVLQQQQGSTDCGVFGIAFPYHAGVIISNTVYYIIICNLFATANGDDLNVMELK